MSNKKIPILIKVILLHSIFLVLHYLHDWLPNLLTSNFSGTNESVYQHMKIGFFSYILLGIVEYFWIRNAIEDTSRYFYARLFSAIQLPLVMMIIYLIGPLVFGQFQSMAAEIIFANLALMTTSLTTFVIEEHIEKSAPSASFKIVTICLFLISLTQFILFTFDLPWFDIFAVPPGW